MKEMIVWVFKILAIMVISLLCWSFFIGNPGTTVSTDTGTVTMGSYVDRGSQFEEWTYGKTTATGATGMKLTSAHTWLRGSDVNGQLSRVWSEDIWKAAKTRASSSSQISTWEG